MKFDSEDDEREFWSTHDSTDHIDWSHAERVRFTNLQRKRPMKKTLMTAGGLILLAWVAYTGTWRQAILGGVLGYLTAVLRIRYMKRNSSSH